MDKNKLNYEAPVAEIWEVKTECGILTVSGVEASRDSYGTAEQQDWN